jgi:hypothetical protein
MFRMVELAPRLASVRQQRLKLEQGGDSALSGNEPDLSPNASHNV